MLSTIWISEFDKAVSAYTNAVHRPALSDAERVSAVTNFRDSAAAFESGDMSEISNSNAIHRNTAARLFLEIARHEASHYILDRLTEASAPLLDTAVLSQLQLEYLTVEDAKDSLVNITPSCCGAVIEAFLRTPSEEGYRLVDDLLYSSSMPNVARQSVIKSVARWNQPELLWAILNGPATPLDDDTPAWLSLDVRLDAALFLGLAGDEKAISLLIAACAKDSSPQVAHAVVRLAWLGLPIAVSLSSKLLASSDPVVAELTLDAIASLRCAESGEALLEFTRKNTRLHSRFTSSALDQMAFDILALIFDGPLPDEIPIVYDEQQYPEILTENTRQQLMDYYESKIPQFLSKRRYFNGELLAPHHFVQALYSPHAGPRVWASYGLRAMTGESYGFNPEWDLIGNIDSIVLWERRMPTFPVAEHGRWIFRGKLLPDP